MVGPKEEKEASNKKVWDTSKLLLTLLILGIIGMVGVGFFYVINKEIFTKSVTATEIYTGNAYMDPEKGILIEKENEDGTVSEVTIEEIFEEMDGAEIYLKDDEKSTKEEKLKYLMNAELVTKFPYIAYLENDESKLNGVLKFYRYTTQLEAEDSENNIGATDTENNNEEKVDTKRIFYIGDSWMEGLKSYIPTDEHPGKDHFLAHKGLGAQAPEFSTENLKNGIDAVKSEVSSIVIMLGLNDCSEAAADKMNEIIDFLSTTYADKTTYVLKVPHVGEAYYDDEHDVSAQKLNIEIDKYNQIILENCSDKANVKFIDVTNNMMTEDLYYLHEQYLTKDGLHLSNNKGYPQWYSNIKKCIAQGKSSVDVEKYQMTYLKEDDFNKMVDNCKASGNREVFKYFTINQDDEIVIATWRNTNKKVTTNDPEITAGSLNEGSAYTFSEAEDGVFSAEKYTITTTSLMSYHTLVEDYAMPFNLLWAFLVQTKDYELTAEIAKLAYESEIKIGIYDNQTTNIQNNSQTYSKSIRYTENTKLILPGVNQTTPSINVNNSKYNNVIRGCYGKISDGVETHQDATKQENRNDGNLYTYYISSMTDDGSIIGITSNQGNAAKFTTTTQTTTTSASTPSIGVFYAKNWIATWKASYQLTAGETKPYSISGTSDDEQYESISESRIVDSLIAGNLTKHSEKIKQEAIEELVRNTSFSVSTTAVTNTIIKEHLQECTSYCQSRLEGLYGKTLKELEEDGELQKVLANIKNNNNGEINKHVQSTKEEKMKDSFTEQLERVIKYEQWPTAEEANANIEFKSTSTKNPYSYEKEDDVILEDEGKKFKEIINKPEYYESKQAILKRTDFFWDYIRAAEDTAKLEDVLRVIFNEAFDTNKFGDFDSEEIDRIFKSFEPKLREVGMGHAQAFSEWLKSYESNSLRKYMNEDGISYESVKDKVTEDREYGKMYYTEGDGCWNFTYGIMVCNKAGKLNNEGIFAEYGYDLADLVRRAKLGEVVTVPMEDLDDIYAELIRRKYQGLKETLKEHDVSLETWQVYGLLNFSYQWGNCGQYIEGENNIAEVYKKYYVEQNDPEAFKKNAVLVTGSGELVHFYFANYEHRQNNAWILFHEGRYILNDGEEIFASGASADSILDACVTVMNELLDANVHYSLTHSGPYPLPSRIDIPDFNGYGCCCATYVSRVLYVSGLLSAEEINAVYFNSSGTNCSNGVEKFLFKAGWTKVSEEEAQPGDVGIWHNGGNGGSGHVFIYAAEKNEVWEQSSGCISMDGSNPTYGSNPNRISYENEHDLCVYRAP